MTALNRTTTATTLVIAVLALASCAIQPGTPEPSPSAPAEPAPAPAPLPDLWEAAGTGNIDGLNAHKRSGTDLDSHQPDIGVTPLTIAAIANQPAASAWLIDNGADVNTLNRDGGTALHVAILVGQAEVAEKMLAAGADVSIPTSDGQSAWDLAGLDWETTSHFASLLQLDVAEDAVMPGREKIIALLQSYLADQGGADIWTATATGDADAVRVQLDRGAYVNAHSPDGATLLSVAALFGHADIAAALIDAGAEVDAQNESNGSTALHGAAVFGRTDIVQLLLDKGADANAMTWDGATPLQAAELDWQTTAYIAEMLNVPLDEEAMQKGKVDAAEILRASLGNETSPKAFGECLQHSQTRPQGAHSL